MKISIKLSARTSLADILEQRREKITENIASNDDYLSKIEYDSEPKDLIREENMIMKYEINIIDNFLEMLENGTV